MLHDYKLWIINKKFPKGIMIRKGSYSLDMQGSYLITDDKTIKKFYVLRNTGLKDKKKRSIFEGDIVKVQIKHETTTPHLASIFINFDGAQIAAHPAHYPTDCKKRQLSDYCGRYSKDCEIIGNVLENHEMFKDIENIYTKLDSAAKNQKKINQAMKHFHKVLKKYI